MNRSYIYVGLTIFLWASTAAVSKLLLSNLTDLQVLLYASLFATIGLFIIILLQKKTAIIKTYTAKDYLTFTYMGFIGVFLYQFLLFRAMSYLPAQEAFIINYLWPIMVVVFAIIILKEDFNIKKFIGIVISFIGVYIVATKGNIFSIHFDSLPGVIFAVFAAVSYGLFSALGKKLHYEEFTSMAFYYLFTFIFTLIFILAYSTIPKVSLFQILGLIWLGLFVSGLAYVFWFLALKYGDTTQMSNAVFLTPFLSLVYIYLLVGEKILSSSIIGLMVIIGGILIQSFKIPSISQNEKIS